MKTISEQQTACVGGGNICAWEWQVLSGLMDAQSHSSSLEEFNAWGAYIRGAYKIFNVT